MDALDRINGSVRDHFGRALLLKFVVVGDPVAQGSKTARIVGKRIKMSGGTAVLNPKAILIENANKSTKTKGRSRLDQWRAFVAEAVRREVEEMEGVVIDEACILEARFYIPRPPSHYKKSGGLTKAAPPKKTSAPDLSKYVRALEDGITQGGGWVDDSLVTGYDGCRKEWTDGKGGVLVKVWRDE